MKKTGGLTKRMVAILLSGMLAVGAIPGTALASEVQENTVQEEEAITTYAVTLDANGGYFFNEWDDVLGEYIESTEILNNQIPVGGTVTSSPVFETDDQQTQTMTFLGWSLERDGELVSQEDEEYIPVDNCVLYAVWGPEEISGNIDDTDTKESNLAEDVPEDESSEEKQDTIYYDEEEAGDVINDVEEQEKSVSENDDQVEEPDYVIEEAGENVRTDAAVSVVEEGTCGDNLTWTLDGGYLIISGTGEMWDYDYTGGPWGTSGINTVEIKTGVTSIGKNAFAQCEDLMSVDIPGSVTEIREEGFYLCTSLSSVILPEGITRINLAAFSCCSSLENISLPNSLIDIGSEAFSKCRSLSNVVILDNVVHIGEFAFEFCTNLTSVTIGEGVTDIGRDAFNGCSKGLVICSYSGSYVEQYANSNSILFSTTSIIARGTCGDNIIWILNLEGTLTISGTGEMEDYTNPNAVPTVKKAPWDIPGIDLKSVIVKNGVTTIGDYAFFALTSIETIYLSNSIVSVGNSSFASCIKLKELDLPSSIVSIGACAFDNCNSLKNLIIPNSVTNIEANAFSDCGSLSSIIISDKVTSIEESVFEKCCNLTSIDIPSSVMSIGDSAFRGCKKISTITIPDGVVSIGNAAFEDCTSLTSITIPESVTGIGSAAFSNCSSLTSITIPASISRIEGATFYGCSSLNSIMIPDNIKSIGNCAFYDCSSLTSITIPDGVTRIEEYTFQGCSSLKSITIPASITSIGNNAFYECSSLTSVTIPASVTSIGSHVFYECSRLKSIHFNGNAPTFTSLTFSGCRSTCYYPINNSTWTEQVTFNYDGSITWVPWNPNTGEIVNPENERDFTLSIGTITNNAVVIGDDGLLSAVAWYDFSNKDTALSEAKNIKWTCSDPNAIEIYDPVYDLETNDVRISLSLRGKKPGSYTITGTAPDGRKASADVVVEPKIVAVSDKKTISETADIEMIQVTLDTGDKTYLTEFLNNITVNQTDGDYGTFSSVESRVSVTDNGNIGQIIWSLKPGYDGSCEYTFTSPGGQKVIEKIYSNTGRYPFYLIGSRWSFNNYSAKPIPLQEDEYSKLTNGMDRTLKKYIDKLIDEAGDGGQCRGLAATSILVNEGRIPLSDIQEGISALFEANKSDKAKSIIGLYYFDQFTDKAIKHTQEFLSLPINDQLKEIEQSSFPLILSFANDGWGAHAVVGYGIEKGDWKIYHDPDTGSISYDSSQGTQYDRRLSVYDSNSVGESSSEGSCLYYNSSNSDWEIPNYYGKGLCSKKTGYLKGAYDDINGIAKVDASAFSVTGVKLFFKTTDGITIENSSGSYNILGETVQKDFMCLYNDAEDNDTSTKTLNVYFKNNTNLTVKPNNNEAADFSLVTPAYYFDIDAQAYENITFDVSGGISAEGIEGDYVFELTSNEENSAVPFHTFVIDGDDAQDISIDLQDDGLHISGENLKDITVTGENDDVTKELNFSTDADEVLIIGNETGLWGLIDTNDDGVFDKDLIGGCSITATPISSKANTNGIEVELDKGSYAVQEGDTLTIDATIKTDKDFVEGQKEYIGYFAYYANRQWNQLTSWDIEGGTTKYRITEKIENWSEFDDVMFTVSVFPKDSFTQGSALVDKVFLVNVSKKSETPDKPDDIVRSGTFGNTLSWSLNKNGTLVITGNGAMPNWRDESTIPWNNYKSDVQSIVIKDGVTSIGTAAFMRCSNVTSVNIAESVVKIEDHAFTECEQLNEITIPNKVTNIGDAAFSFCSNLNTIAIPGSVSSIGKCSFEGCDNLQSVEISEGVSTIDKWAFRSCGNLLKVKIPESVNNIGDEAFTNCSKDLVIYGIAKSYAEKYATEKELIFIDPSNVGYAVVSGITNKTYTGKALIQTLAVKIDEASLKEGTDYTVTYSNNTNAGTATATITGKGNYNGTKNVAFKINKANQSITAKASASSIAVGKTATVSITGAKGTKSFKSSDTSIATVNASTGVVTGKKAGTVTITATSAATSNYNAASKAVKIAITANKSLKRPGKCRFVKWNNSKYTSCQIAWNKVDGADGYQTLLCWTNGSHTSITRTKSNVLYRNCTVHPQHVSQMKVRAFYMQNGQYIYGPWSNIEYITPSPAKLTTKNISSKSNIKVKVSWNIIYGCNGYNVFITTNPNGKWYWNQSTSVKATATSAVIDKCNGKLKKNTRYYIRIVTRRKRNGVFCTVPVPAKNTYVGSFIIK